MCNLCNFLPSESFFRMCSQFRLSGRGHGPKQGKCLDPGLFLGRWGALCSCCRNFISQLAPCEFHFRRPWGLFLETFPLKLARLSTVSYGLYPGKSNSRLSNEVTAFAKPYEESQKCSATDLPVFSMKTKYAHSR
jgi:hypothetical protein